jgi:hypothetical protein
LGAESGGAGDAAKKAGQLARMGEARVLFSVNPPGDFNFGGTGLEGSGARQWLPLSLYASAAVVAVGSARFPEIIQ